MDFSSAHSISTATTKPSVIRFFVRSYTPKTSIRTSYVSFTKKPNKCLVLASNEDPKFDHWEQMELKFGRLTGEDPELTLAKIMARKSNPDVSYLEVEKSFYERRGKSVGIEEVSFDVSDERKSTSSLNGVKLVRPVPKNGVKFDADSKPIKTDVKKARLLVRKPTDNTRSLLPKVILRKPTRLNEDDIGAQESSPLRIKPQLLLQMRNDQPVRKPVDSTTGSLPNVILRKPTLFKEDDIATQESAHGNDQQVRSPVDSTRGSLPNVTLRKPNTFNEDFIATKTSAQVRIKPNLVLKMGNKEIQDNFSDITLLKKPEPISGNLNLDKKQKSTAEANFKGIDNFEDNRFSDITLLKKPEPMSGNLNLGKKQESNAEAKVKGIDSFEDNSFSDITLLNKPEPMSGNLTLGKKQFNAQAIVKGIRNFEDHSQRKDSIATEASNMVSLLSQPTQMAFGLDMSKNQESSYDHKHAKSGDDFKVNSLKGVNVSAGKVKIAESNSSESTEIGNASFPRDSGLEYLSTTGLQPLVQSAIGSYEKISASEMNLTDSNRQCFMDSARQGNHKRLDQCVKAPSTSSRKEIAMSNLESDDGVLELVNFLETSPIMEHEVIDWTRMENLVKTGDKARVEVISSSTRGFIVSFGSLVGYLPYRDVAPKWKFLAFESWLRRKGMDPSKYKHNLGIIGNFGISGKTSLNSSLGPEINQNVDVDISSDMPLEHLLRIYDQEKVNYLSSFVGEEMIVHVLLADRNSKRLIFSCKKKEEVEVVERKLNLMAKLSIGDVVKCRITKINYTGIFVEVERVSALIHQTELSWDDTLDPASYYKVGQIVEAKVHQLDFSTGRIYLSLKEVTPDPVTEALDSVIGDRDSLNGRSKGAQENTEWTEVESLIKELQQIDGIQSVSKGRFFLSPGLTPTFQVYMASMFQNEYKLLARSENKVQEVIVQTFLGKEEMKSAILSCTERVE